MIAIKPIFLAAACAVALSACASAPPAPSALPAPPASWAKAPPAGAASAIQPIAAEVPAYGTANTANTGGTYPYGTIQKAGLDLPQQATAASEDEIVVLGPDGSVWLRSIPDDTAYQGDVDSCYAYARGQIAHDVRIENDVRAAFQSEAGGLGLAALRGRMNDFERSNRMPSLFNSCMTAKGYSDR